MQDHRIRIIVCAVGLQIQVARGESLFVAIDLKKPTPDYITITVLFDPDGTELRVVVIFLQKLNYILRVTYAMFAIVVVDMSEKPPIAQNRPFMIIAF